MSVSSLLSSWLVATWSLLVILTFRVSYVRSVMSILSRVSSCK